MFRQAIRRTRIRRAAPQKELPRVVRFGPDLLECGVGCWPSDWRDVKVYSRVSLKFRIGECHHRAVGRCHSQAGEGSPLVRCSTKAVVGFLVFRQTSSKS